MRMSHHALTIPSEMVDILRQKTREGCGCFRDLFGGSPRSANPSSPYSIRKRPEPQFCPKFVPAFVRRLFVTCDVFARYFFVAFSWFFRDFFVALISLEKQYLSLFRGPRFGQILRVLTLEKSSEFVFGGFQSGGLEFVKNLSPLSVRGVV